MSRRVNDRGTVSLMIRRGKIKAVFQIFKADVSMTKFTSNSKLSILSLLQVIFKSLINGL